MGRFFCPVSGCTPAIVCSMANTRCNRQSFLDLNVVNAFIDLQKGEYTSQNDISVIGPIHSSGQPFAAGMVDGIIPNRFEYHFGIEAQGPLPTDVCPETDVCVISKGSLHHQVVHAGPLGTKARWKYFIAYGSSIAVQTYALDIMGVATAGRMTPLRLWRLAMKQGFYEKSHPTGLEGVDYGEVEKEWNDYPFLFPGFGEEWESEINQNQCVEEVKQQLMYEGKFWLWMAPDRFMPVLRTKHEPCAQRLRKSRLGKNHLSVLEKLPIDILVAIVSILPLQSLFNLASTSRLLRKGIFGNDYFACVWLSTSAPWWIPVPTRTGEVTENQEKTKSSVVQPYLASRSTPDCQQVDRQLSTVGLDWAYVRRCARSGSMRNRRRIWNTVLDIERAADLSGV